MVGVHRVEARREAEEVEVGGGQGEVAGQEADGVDGRPLRKKRHQLQGGIDCWMATGESLCAIFCVRARSCSWPNSD